MATMIRRWKVIMEVILVICLVLLVFYQSGYSQAGSQGSGPGGVGSTDGTSSLQLWLRGDAGTFSDTACTTTAVDAGPVACWTDQSGSGNSAAQATDTNQPLYVSTGLNGNPMLGFDGTNHYLDIPYTSELNSTNFTLYVVSHATSGANTFRAPFSSRCGNDANTRSGYNFFASYQGLWEFWAYSPNDNQWKIAAGPSSEDGVWHIMTGMLDLPNWSQYLYFDGQLLVHNTGMTFRANTACPSRVGAGGTESPAGLFFPGEIAEVLFYNTNLNSLERTLVDNYLGAKYAITISNDQYHGNDTAYFMNVAGIAKTDAGVNSTAHSGGIVLMDVSYLQDNGDFLLFGHPAGSNSKSTADLPTSGSGWGDGNDRRWTRDWYLAVTDVNANGGAFDIVFDFSEGAMVGIPEGSASNYRLLTRSGTSGQYTDLGQATSLSGDQVVFDGIDLSSLGSYVTLGTTDLDNSPLAVELSTFSARQWAGGGLLAIAAVALLGMLVGIAWFRRWRG